MQRLNIVSSFKYEYFSESSLIKKAPSTFLKKVNSASILLSATAYASSFVVLTKLIPAKKKTKPNTPYIMSDLYPPSPEPAHKVAG